MSTTAQESGHVFRDAIADLRRRRVFRVAGAYAVCAWVVIEASDVVLPALGVRDSAITWVVLAALVGFPLTLVLTWVFDVTGGRIVRTVPDVGQHARVVRMATGALIVVTAMIAIAAAWVVRPGLGLVSASEHSIAVLPFVDLSENQDSEYFGDGIAEELLNRLVSVDGLRVAARTSSFAFKERERDIREIGSALDVSTVLEGSVRRAGDRVRVTAQLIKVEDGFHLWSQSYDRTLDDIFAIQDEISTSITDALKLTLIGSKPVQPGRQTANIRAYDLYLLGRHHWHQRTGESLARARGLFQEAIGLDPDFALAHSGLADTYLLMDGYGELSSEEAVRRAEPHVARALALDSGLAEAYASLGLLRLNSGEADAAELALRGATNINPNYSMAHMWLGLALEKTGDIRAAHDEYLRAVALDPLHPVANHNAARSYQRFGDYEAARKHIGIHVERGPDDGRGSLALAELDLEFGRLADAARGATGVASSSESKMAAKAKLILASVLMRSGEFERAEEMLAGIQPEIDQGAGDVMRLRLALATDDRSSLIEIAQRGIQQRGDCRGLPEQDMQRLGCFLSGMALVFAGQEADGLSHLQAALPAALKFAVDATPELVTSIHLISSRASGALGDTAQATQSLELALAYGREALDDGWRQPGLLFILALAGAFADDDAIAVDYFDQAIEMGWTDYWVFAGLEDVRDVLEKPPLESRTRAVRVSLDAIGSEIVEMLEAGAGIAARKETTAAAD